MGSKSRRNRRAKATSSGRQTRAPVSLPVAVAPAPATASLEEALQRALRDREVLEGDVERLKQQLGHLSVQLKESQGQLSWMENTRSWTVTEPLRSSASLARQSVHLVKSFPRQVMQFADRARGGGLLEATRWLRDVVRATVAPVEADSTSFYRRQLRTILARHGDRPIIVAPPLVDWNVPLFQRPQHLAMTLAREGFLYFYCTGNAVYDRYDGFVQVGPGCYITNQSDLVLGINRRKTIHLASTAMRIDLEFVRRTKQRGDWLLYEYIDEIHPDISGEIPRSAMQRHYALLADESVTCVATADKLLRDVESVRRSNYGLVTNGVEYEHFARARTGLPVPPELQGIAKTRRPVIGYFGALAKWFDYEMIRRLARERPNYDILLIGFDYDGSLREARLGQHKNVKVIGPINYRQLPRYAQLFDVSTIPFVINDITESTSPIKLFEYMALGRPIVTSAMPECRKYESCLIAESTADFVTQVDAALKLRTDATYLATLQREAEANTWQSKAGEISKLLQASFGVKPVRTNA